MPDVLLVDRVQRRLFKEQGDFDEAGLVGLRHGGFREWGRRSARTRTGTGEPAKPLGSQGDDGVEAGVQATGQ